MAMDEHRFRHRCIGDAEAAYICVSPECLYKCPFLCLNYESCCCNEHHHNYVNNFLTLNDFMARIQFSEPQSLTVLRKKLLSSLLQLRNDFSKVLAEQQRKINDYVDKISKVYCQGACSFKNPKDIEYKTGKDLRKMLQRQPEGQVTLPASVLAHADKSIKFLQRAYYDFRDALGNFSENNAILSRIDSTNQLVYQDEPAPLRHILTQDFSKVKVIICDHAIADLKLVECFRNFSSNSLKILSLKNNNIGDTEIDSIVCAHLPNLVEFKACGNLITDIGAAKIAQAQWPRLGYFNLHSNRITSKGAIQLLKRYAQALWRFDLDSNLIQDDLFKEVVRLNWELLTEVHLGDNEFSDSVRRKLDSFFKNDVRVSKVYIIDAY